MSALLFDLGNTRWKVAPWRDGEIGTVLSGAHSGQPLPNDVFELIAGDLDEAYVASVAAADVTDPLLAVLEHDLGMRVHQVTATQAMPNLRSGYRRPEQLGVDRLMAMVAARAATTAPLCVIDAGTAVTLDFVAADGRHLGGFILPGVRMFRDCLLANTSIPRDARVTDGDVLGRDTPTAVALGARYAVSGIVETFLSGSRALFGAQRADIVVGGGDAAAFVDLLPARCITLEHLVLRGLAVVAGSGEEA